MKKFILLVFLILAGIGGCNKPENKSNREESSLKISSGFMCGWGAGEDSLYISSTVIKYVYYVPAKSVRPEINKTRATTETEWASVLNSLDLDNFVKLNYNSCNICVDGCDEWIRILDDKISHQIKFGMGAKIDSISDLQTIIAQYRSEFSK